MKLRTALTLCLLLAPLAHAAETARPSPETPPMDQVVVQATRANLQKLGNEVVLMEWQFFKRYNDVNKKREYAVYCYNEASTGSRFRKPYCQPLYQTEAQESEARAFLNMLGGGQAAGGLGRGPGNPLPMIPAGSGGASSGGASARMAIEAGRPAFKDNVRKVVEGSPELQKMLQEHAIAWRRYADMWEQLNGRALPEDKPVPGDKDALPDTPAPTEEPK